MESTIKIDDNGCIYVSAGRVKVKYDKNNTNQTK